MRTIIVTSFAVLLIPWTAGAQPVELAGGVDFVLPQPTFTYQTRYVPPVQHITDFTGEAGQTLTLHRKRRPAIWGAIAWFPAAHAGIEARARYRSAPLEGTSGPHALTLTYTSRQPPSYTPTQITIERSEAQPDPEGELREFSIDLLAVGRFGDPARLQVRISGGVAAFAISGDMRPLNFGHFQLGGHSTMASFDHAVTLEVERTWGIGAAGGVDLHHAFTPHVGITAGARFLAPQTIDAPVTVSAVEEDFLTPSIEYVQEWMQPAPLRIRPWTFDLSIGVRFTF